MSAELDQNGVKALPVVEDPSSNSLGLDFKTKRDSNASLLNESGSWELT